jgi:signal transduction histidine kinase
MDHRLIGTGTRQPLDGAAALAADELRQARQAQALRDRVMEHLTALRMDAAWMRTHLSDSRALEGKLDEAAGLLANALTATQEVAAGLRPLALDDLGLAAALEGGTAGGTGK